MARSVAFRQADITRAMKGAIAAGLKPSRADIDRDGKITLVFGEAAPPEPATDFDKWKAGRDARAS